MRHFLLIPCLALFGVLAWFAVRDGRPAEPVAWKEVAPGVFRSPGSTSGYALVDGDRALLIDAPEAADGLGGKTVDAVLLTHHHRDSAAQAAAFRKAGVTVRAPKASAEWLTPDGVRKYWTDSLPLRNSRTAYLVLAEGVEGVDCSLADGQTIAWRGWTIQVVETPGHSRDHVAYAVRKGDRGPLLVFCGDAFTSSGKLWTPYTTDWDHWTDQGLKPTYQSLRKLADLKPAVLLPAHGPVLERDCEKALRATADAVEEVAFLKSFERYTKQRLGNAPEYAFLAREQAESNGSKLWSRISEHLYLTGNTYVLVSKDEGKPFLVMDPWDPHSAKQIPKLRTDTRLGQMEVVLCSHAHYDHYDGIYAILERGEKPQFWTLDLVAEPLAEPQRLRAPFLDARPVKIDRRARDGETVAWREYRLRFRYLPGQTLFTMGVETDIDGKRCFFTADNFFHQDQFSGSGGWMGLNRSGPLLYAESARKVLDAKPDWVLCEHGGAMEFNAEDFRRREEWGKVGAKATDAVCLSGDHRVDWDPHAVRMEPVLTRAKPGETINADLVLTNRTGRKRTFVVKLEGRGLTEDLVRKEEVAPGATVRLPLTLPLSEQTAAGRQVFTLRTEVDGAAEGSDAFLAVDVAP
jgi:glyoxylase-like metal-dependent hydrolase (beta-lactamase superfamily II)